MYVRGDGYGPYLARRETRHRQSIQLRGNGGDQVQATATSRLELWEAKSETKAVALRPGVIFLLWSIATDISNDMDAVGLFGVDSRSITICCEFGGMSGAPTYLAANQGTTEDEATE